MRFFFFFFIYQVVKSISCDIVYKLVETREREENNGITSIYIHIYDAKNY